MSRSGPSCAFGKMSILSLPFDSRSAVSAIRFEPSPDGFSSDPWCPIRNLVCASAVAATTAPENRMTLKARRASRLRITYLPRIERVRALSSAPRRHCRIGTPRQNVLPGRREKLHDLGMFREGSLVLDAARNDAHVTRSATPRLLVDPTVHAP